MRYFTPERWMKLQHVHTKQAFYSTHEDWERARTAYRQKLNRVLGEFPGRVKRFAESECLHDARVLAIWQGRSRLNFILRPDPPTEELITLTYTLFTSPQIDCHALSSDYRTKHAAWMYDELGIERLKGGDVAFIHNILLSNGWELAIRFRRFDFSRSKVLLLDPDKEFLLTHFSKPGSARGA
jgi:hypothetical protein